MASRLPKLAETSPLKSTYAVRAYAPSVLSRAEIASCLKIVRDGGAVAVSLDKLQKAKSLAVAWRCGLIVGVGSVKCDRPDRAADLARASGFGFPTETSELGYIAVDPAHRRQGLSRLLVNSLLNAVPGSLFATTDDERMMKTLSGAGFTRHGKEWQGRRGWLSLWLKEGKNTKTA